MNLDSKPQEAQQDKCYIKRTNTLLFVCLCLSPSGSVSLSVFLVSVASVVCAVWLVALCGVCTWCQRKLVSYSAHYSHCGTDIYLNVLEVLEKVISTEVRLFYTFGGFL